MLRFYRGDIVTMTGNNIFVFGSNIEGRHGLGAAELAKKFGAKRNVAKGLMGNSYAIPTKNLTPGAVFEGRVYHRYGRRSISLTEISGYIDELYELARQRPELTFFIAYKNTPGFLNGYKPTEIIDCFTKGKDVPSNIRFHNSFREYLGYPASDNQA